MSDDLRTGRSRYVAAGSAYGTRTGWSAEDLKDIAPDLDARVTSGYDPDADGSYYPDPEDYPPLSDDAGFPGHSTRDADMPETSWAADPTPTMSPLTAEAGTAGARARTLAPPHVTRPVPGTSPQQPRRSSGFLLLLVAVAVLGLIAAGLFSYRLITSPKANTSTVVTPTEQTPQDNPTERQTPTTTAPEITSPAEPLPTLDTQPPTITGEDRDDDNDDRDDDQGRDDD